MASPILHPQNGGTDHILRPRPVKPSNPMILRAQSEEGTLRPNGQTESQLSAMSTALSRYYDLALLQFGAC